MQSQEWKGQVRLVNVQLSVDSFKENTGEENFQRRRNIAGSFPLTAAQYSKG